MKEQQHTGDRLIDGCRHRVEQETRKFPFQEDPIRVEFWAMYEHSKALLDQNKRLKNELARVASKMAKCATLPEHADQMKWFKTTPQAEKRRVCGMFSAVNNRDKVIALKIIGFIRTLKP